jgi:outer membrane lipoprotein-sorting protein
MKADKVVFRGTMAVDRRECYVVHVSNADATEYTDWYFSTFDAYPRRVARFKKDSAGQVSMTQVTLKNIAANPGMMRDPFKKYVPEGYQVISSVEKKEADQKTDQKSEQSGAKKPEPTSARE